MEVYKIFNIESARSLPNLPEGHPCKNIHGHSYFVEIFIIHGQNKNTHIYMHFSIDND